MSTQPTFKNFLGSPSQKVIIFGQLVDDHIRTPHAEFEYPSVNNARAVHTDTKYV